MATTASVVCEAFLRNFCSPYPELTTALPYIAEGKTYATNGRILVVVNEPVYLTEEAPDGFPLASVHKDIIPQAEGVEVTGDDIAVAGLGPVPKVSCGRCQGTGAESTAICPCCKGDGYTRAICDSCGVVLDQHTCHRCGGECVVPAPAGTPATVCEFCEGKGTLVDKSWQANVGNAYAVSGELLEQLQLLPGCRIPYGGSARTIKRGIWDHGVVYFVAMPVEG